MLLEKEAIAQESSQLINDDDIYTQEEKEAQQINEYCTRNFDRKGVQVQYKTHGCVEAPYVNLKDKMEYLDQCVKADQDITEYVLSSELTCDVLDGWDGQSSDVLKGWIGKSSPILSEPYDIKTTVALESLEDQHKAILTEIESCEDWEQISELEEKAQEIFKQIKAEKEILKRIKAEKPKKQKKESKLRKKSSEPKMIQGIKGKPVINYGVKGEQRQKLIDFLTEWRTKSEIMEYMGWKEGYCRNHFTYIINWGYDLLKEGRKENRRYKIES